MRWRGHGQSDNVEDRRSKGGPALAFGGGGTLIIIIISMLFGVNPMKLLQQGGIPGGGGGGAQQQKELSDEEKRYKDFAGTVLKFTEDVWDEQFQKMGKPAYKHPKMVLFYERVSTGGCGTAPSAVGPFYCPADQTVYLDPTFFRELEQKLGGSAAEFSQAYVIAHEVGHHVQNLLGYSRYSRQQQASLPKDSAEYNQWSVRLELQADYLAGVWAHYSQKEFRIVEEGDIDSAITSAKAIGDDRLQKRSSGFTSPEKYTHGTSAQRVKWFRRGWETGSLEDIEALFKLPYRQL